ncbi:DUF4956 domain-containing protein [Breznakia blatticola]|nr:DUF4956 domain-containing protein [Breznakia blatticola]
MLETLLNMSTDTTTLSLTNLLLSMSIALVLGASIAFTYKHTSKNHYSQNLISSLLLLPVLMCCVFLLIGNNVAGAFSLAGVFSVIRFRSAPGSSRDIVYILFCVAVGLACGLQAPLFAIIITVCICIVFFILDLLQVSTSGTKRMKLVMLVPEEMNEEENFSEILKDYTKSYELVRMRTKDFGSIFELTYVITLYESQNKHELLDSLRCRNANLNISLSNMMHTDEF